MKKYLFCLAVLMSFVIYAQNTYIENYHKIDFRKQSSDTLKIEHLVTFSSGRVIEFMRGKKFLMFYDQHLHLCQNPELCDEFNSAKSKVFFFQEIENGVRILFYNSSEEDSLYSLDIYKENGRYYTRFSYFIIQCLKNSFIPDFILNEAHSDMTVPHEVISLSHAEFVYNLCKKLTNKITFDTNINISKVCNPY